MKLRENLLGSGLELIRHPTGGDFHHLNATVRRGITCREDRESYKTLISIAWAMSLVVDH